MMQGSVPVAVVTGANSGVGFETTRALAARGATVVMICRDAERAAAARNAIRAEYPMADLVVELADLASLAAVRDVADRLRRRFESLQVLVNNAGVYRAQREITVDGFEMTLATNHLAHFLLTGLLLEPLQRGTARVINVASEAHRAGALDRAPLERILRGEVPYRALRAYGDSKLANLWFSAELARRHPSDRLTVSALHPGMLATRIWNQNANLVSRLMQALKPIMGRPGAGGRSILRILDAPRTDVHGRYYDQTREKLPSALARDAGRAAELWALSGRLTGLA